MDKVNIQVAEEEYEQYKKIRDAQMKIIKRRNDEQQRKAEKALLENEQNEVWDE